MVLLYGGGNPRLILSCVLADLQRQASIGNALYKKHGAMVIVVTRVTAVGLLLVQSPLKDFDPELDRCNLCPAGWRIKGNRCVTMNNTIQNPISAKSLFLDPPFARVCLRVLVISDVNRTRRTTKTVNATE